MTGLWSLDPASGDLFLLNHAPSGNFTPLLDSFGRLLFTQWDHLQRDQQADADNHEGGGYGTFDYADESAGAARLDERHEVFPEPRAGPEVAGSNLNTHTFNHFFPWTIAEDGLEGEVLNHLGRHELHGYMAQSINDDSNLVEYYGQYPRTNPNPIDNLFQIAEDPEQAGRYLGVDAPEFATHAAGQIVRLEAPPDRDADAITVDYLTHPDTADYPADDRRGGANHSGHYRDPLPLTGGGLVAAHASETRAEANQGPSRYHFRPPPLGLTVWIGCSPVERQARLIRTGTPTNARAKESAMTALRPNRFLVLLLLLLLSFASAQTYVELILDASGSMWNKLADDEYRIVAAKAALTSFVSSLSADETLNVGLRVYGSRLPALDEGACQDSVLLVPLAGFEREALLQGVRDSQAKGATPIAYSIEAAASDFPAEGRKIIVLVTDGEESCGGDVRAALEALRAQGIDIELKIIGFDLDERAVASFEGLGSFENARNASDLAAALGRAVEVEPVETTYVVTVTVTRDGAPAADGVRVQFRDSVGEEAYDFAMTTSGTLQAELPAGSYQARIEDAFSDAPVEVGGLNVLPETENAFAFELVQETDVAVTVTPTDPVTGSRVTVSFAGAPDNDRDWITVVPAEVPDEIYLGYANVAGASGQVELRVPDEATTLEARYYLALPEGGSRVIGRSEPFTSVAATATLEVPAEVVMGSRFEVVWSGPDNQGDYLTLVPADTPDGDYATYALTQNGNPITFTAPIEVGAYEMRYQTGDSSQVLARAPIAVIETDYAVQAPAEVAGNSPFEVAWTGPGNPQDYITIVPAGAPEGSYLDYAYTTEGNPVALMAPVEPGAYEVRYSSEQASPNPTLASTPITVFAATYELEAPAEVEAGASFQVTWTGPGNSRDYITIVPAGAPEGAYLDYAYTSEGNPATLTAPAEPGAYEIRYAADGIRNVFARLAITVR